MSTLVALLVWAAAGYRFTVLLRHPTLLNATYLASMALAAAAFTVKAFETTLNATVGPFTGDLIKHLLVVGMGASLQVFILAVEVERPTRRQVAVRVGVAVLVAAAMIAAFVAAPLHTLSVTDPEHADDAYKALASIQVYLLIFHVYLTVVLVDNVRLYRRFGSSTGDQGRSTNLRLVGWGSAIALAYTGSRLASVMSIAVAGHPLNTLETIGSLAALFGGTCVALAVFSPRVIPWFKDWHTARVGTRRLNRLWRDLTSTFPAVVLSAPGLKFAPRRAEFIFDRRLIETSECLRRVRLPDASAAIVHGSSVAIRALAIDLYHHHGNWTAATGPAAQDLLPPVHSHTEEVAMLLEVADHYEAAARQSAPIQPVRP